MKYPNPEDKNDCTSKFKAHKKQIKLPFYLVCDFESFLTPVDDDDDDVGEHTRGTQVIDEHRVCGFACHRVTDIGEYQTDPVVYSGYDVMSKFYNYVINESKIISEILKKNRDIDDKTEKEKTDYDVAIATTRDGRRRRKIAIMTKRTTIRQKKSTYTTFFCRSFSIT